MAIALDRVSGGSYYTHHASQAGMGVSHTASPCLPIVFHSTILFSLSFSVLYFSLYFFLNLLLSSLLFPLLFLFFPSSSSFPALFLFFLNYRILLNCHIKLHIPFPFFHFPFCLNQRPGVRWTTDKTICRDG